MDEPGIFATMFSMRAMRRLRADAVPDELIRRALEAGTQAPSGANSQPWSFLVVRDRATKEFVQERYHRAMTERFAPFLPFLENRELAEARNLKAAMYLAEHLHEAPVLLVVCGQRDWPAAVPEDQRVGKAPPSYGSVYPCIQNILLACRALGLGASLTTAHMLFEDELAAFLGVPEDHGMVAIMPIGYPRGRFGRVSRRPIEELTHYDRWGRRASASGSLGNR
jgi:nitroreductase